MYEQKNRFVVPVFYHVSVDGLYVGRVDKADVL